MLYSVYSEGDLIAEEATAEQVKAIFERERVRFREDQAAGCYDEDDSISEEYFRDVYEVVTTVDIGEFL
jgi:hypothetical protein